MLLTILRAADVTGCACFKIIGRVRLSSALATEPSSTRVFGPGRNIVPIERCVSAGGRRRILGVRDRAIVEFDCLISYAGFPVGDLPRDFAC